MIDEAEHNRQIYSKIAKQWADKNHAPDYWRPEFEKFQTFLPKGKVIDIGCGTGKDAGFFVDHGYGYLGIDYSEAMLDEARKRAPGVDFRHMDMFHLAFPSSSFDGFWAAASLLHISKEKLPEVLVGIKKIIKPGGIGFVSVKEGSGEKVVEGEMEGDSRFFSFWQLPEMEQILADNGFKVLDSARVTKTGKDKREKVWLTIWLTNIIKV